MKEVIHFFQSFVGLIFEMISWNFIAFILERVMFTIWLCGAHSSKYWSSIRSSEFVTRLRYVFRIRYIKSYVSLYLVATILLQSF